LYNSIFSTIVRISLFLGFFLIFQDVQGQKMLEDITKIFEFDVGPERNDSTFKQAKIVLAPIVSFEPNTSLGFGVGAKLLFKPKGAGAETRFSNIPVSVQYTLRNQFIFFSEYEIFFPGEQYLLKGNLAYSKFPIGYYGVGSTSKDADVVDISFNNVLFEPLLLKSISSNFFVGGGWRLNTFTSLSLLDEGEPTEEELKLRDELGSISSGLELAMTFDSRDNLLNAHKGVFAEFTHGFYQKAFGSSDNFMLTKLNFRQYWTLSSRRPHNVLAIELFTRLSWGSTPLLDLPALGGSELLRGFREGRFRDKYAFFGQAEYRVQATEHIGFVLFGGIGEVTNSLSNLQVNNLKYSVGTGIRFKIVKSENLNIRIDYAYGFGTSRDQNFYLGIAEAF